VYVSECLLLRDGSLLLLDCFLHGYINDVIVHKSSVFSLLQTKLAVMLMPELTPADYSKQMVARRVHVVQLFKELTLITGICVDR